MPKCDPESNLLTNRLTTQSFESPAKNEWALQRGRRSAHPFSWLLSSPQQPLETEDPPTVSLAPQYTSQRLCRARVIFFAFRNPCKVITSSNFLRICRIYRVNHSQSNRVIVSLWMSRNRRGR